MIRQQKPRSPFRSRLDSLSSYLAETHSSLSYLAVFLSLLTCIRVRICAINRAKIHLFRDTAMVLHHIIYYLTQMVGATESTQSSKITWPLRLKYLKTRASHYLRHIIPAAPPCRKWLFCGGRRGRDMPEIDIRRGTCGGHSSHLPD